MWEEVSEKGEDPKNNNALMRAERTYFVGDRVIFSQVTFFLLAGSLASLIEMSNISKFFVSTFWWLFCLILPLLGLFLVVGNTPDLYFKHHWKTMYLYLLLIWVPPVIFLGVLFDSMFIGNYNTLMLCFFLSLIFGAGYGLAKLLRLWRDPKKNENLLGIGALFALGAIIASITIGGVIYNDALAANGLDLFDFWEIREVQSCITGIYIILTGPGIVISMGVHYYMFHCLYDPKGLDVARDPPNQLYLRIMIISLVIGFIAWLLLMIVFPPIAAGGKGGGKGKGRRRSGGSSSTHSHRHYATSGASTKKVKRFRRDRVEEEWEQYHLPFMTDFQYSTVI